MRYESGVRALVWAKGMGALVSSMVTDATPTSAKRDCDAKDTVMGKKAPASRPEMVNSRLWRERRRVRRGGRGR
jgi:hypothetical protein